MGQPSLREFMEQRTAETSCTPDMPFLNRMYDEIPVFVYGTEKEGFSEGYYLAKKGRLIGEGRTSDQRFFTVISEYSSPVALRDYNGSPKLGAIYGQLWAISPELLAVLDMKYCNTLLFSRTRTMVKWHKTEEQHKKNKMVYFTEAYFYLGRDEYWTDERLAKLKAGKFFTARDGTPYYSYTSVDDAENNAWKRNS